MDRIPSVAIIGAGLAGITVANSLGQKFETTVFEKSKGLGGRMSFRRHDEFCFNHGAQFLTARSEEFRKVVEAASENSVLKEWIPKLTTLDPTAKAYKREWFEPHYVAIPGMNNLAKYLSASLNPVTGKEIKEIVGDVGCWTLLFSDGESSGPFDWVVSAAPSTQSQNLLPRQFAYHQLLESVKFSACFALMLGFDKPIDLGFDAAVVKNSLLAWISNRRHSSHSSVLVHASNQWSSDHIEDDIEHVNDAMFSEFNSLFQNEFSEPATKVAHRWRYARCEAPLEELFLADHDNQLAVCGDWCGGNRVESAFTSGRSLANHLLENW